MDCQKSTFKPYSRSLPRSGSGSGRLPPEPPRNRLSKMSRNWKLPAPPARSQLRFRLRRIRLVGLLLAHEFAKVESAEVHAAGARAGAAASIRGNIIGVKSVLVVDLALVLIAQDVISFLDILEAILCCLIARIHVGMVLTRQFAVSFAYFLRTGAFRHAK